MKLGIRVQITQDLGYDILDFGVTALGSLCLVIAAQTV